MKEKKIQCQNNNNNNCSLKGKKLHSYKQLKNLGGLLKHREKPKNSPAP